MAYSIESIGRKRVNIILDALLQRSKEVFNLKTPIPRILPEDMAPENVKTCRLCELSHHKTRVIWGEGAPGAPVFVILDNPGAREDKEGNRFLCGTRETLQLAAYEAGLNPGMLYITFILKCRPRKAYNKPLARDTCINYLWGQLETQHPEIIICLGDVACQSFFGDPGIQAKGLRGKIHIVKGYRVIVSYHPLAVRRRPVLYRYFLEDWESVAKELKAVL